MANTEEALHSDNWVISVAILTSTKVSIDCIIPSEHCSKQRGCVHMLDCHMALCKINVDFWSSI